MRNFIKKSINLYNNEIYNNFENLWKTEFNIFRSDLNQYLIEKNIEPFVGFISFESLGTIVLNLKNMFSYNVQIDSVDYLKDFRYPFLLNTRLPFKNSYDPFLEDDHDHFPSLLDKEGFNFINRDGTRQLYFSLLDRKYSNKWYIPTENLDLSKKRLDIKYVHNKNTISGRFLNYTNYFIVGINCVNKLCYIPINEKSYNTQFLKLVKYTEIIQIKFDYLYFKFSITPFGVLIWDCNDKPYLGNITKIIKNYEY